MFPAGEEDGVLVFPSSENAPEFIFFLTDKKLKAPASFLFAETLKLGLPKEAPISLFAVTLEEIEIVGRRYVGKAVGNKILSNNSTKLYPFNEPAVVPIPRPPT